MNRVLKKKLTKKLTIWFLIYFYFYLYFKQGYVEKAVFDKTTTDDITMPVLWSTVYIYIYIYSVGVIYVTYAFIA